MARYFLHLSNSFGFIHDEEGAEAADLSDARTLAVTTIRSLLSDEIKDGRFNLKGKIEIADDRGVQLAVVPFSDAVEVADANARMTMDQPDRPGT
ncbi:DUF6894 family protein [Sphingomonas gellani]|nr:hypothetical protein [Sphingomonas gellani]